jgi:hypothetical protein
LTAAFYNRYNGVAVVTPWIGKPNPQEFDRFIECLVDRIEAASENAAKKGQESFANEIRGLKKLVDEGMLTQEEFEIAKKKLLSPPPRANIDFSQN